MASNYQHSETPLSDVYATTHSSLKSDLLFDIANYGFSDIENTEFVQRGASTLSGWGTTAEVVRYAMDNSPLPFCSKESCPVPEYYSSGEHSIALVGNYYTDVRHVRYNSSNSYCEISTDKRTWSKIDDGFSSLFVGLQGGGGGGGGGDYNNGLAGADAKGGGGGGGGAFIFCFLDLKSYPDQIITLAPGAAGNAGSAGGRWADIGTDPTAGGGGGDSMLAVNYVDPDFIGPVLEPMWVILRASGGKGGSSAGASGWGGSAGGAGGKTSISDSIPTWITVLNYYYGKPGGSSGEHTGFVAGIPGGCKNGTDGGSFIESDSLNVPILNASLPIVRKGDPWSTVRNSGCGQPAYNSDGGAYSSGGGGGGASVMGSCSVNSPYYLYDYGMGGGGGTATTSSSTNGSAGTPGCIFIAACIKI